MAYNDQGGKIATRLKNFTQVSNDLLDYGAQACGNAQHVYFLILLIRYAWNRGNAAYPSQERLARQMNLSIKQVARIAKALAKMGLIMIHTRWEHDRRRNYYVVNHRALDELWKRMKAEENPKDEHAPEVAGGHPCLA